MKIFIEVYTTPTEIQKISDLLRLKLSIVRPDGIELVIKGVTVNIRFGRNKEGVPLVFWNIFYLRHSSSTGLLLSFIEDEINPTEKLYRLHLTKLTELQVLAKEEDKYLVLANDKVHFINFKNEQDLAKFSTNCKNLINQHLEKAIQVRDKANKKIEKLQALL